MDPQPRTALEFTKALEKVQEEIAAAAHRVGRNPEEIRLVGVSKTYPVAALELAYEAGLRDFGENRTMELSEKADALKQLPDIRWHAIGRLQRNKAREVAAVAHEFHALDSVRLAEALEAKLVTAGRTLDVYLQVNTSGEPQKGGCEPADLPALLETAQRAVHLQVVGLMTMAAASPEESIVRGAFQRLRQLRDQHLPGGELSMGMSNDFPLAIAEGATVVRVGSRIFGTRSPR